MSGGRGPLGVFFWEKGTVGENFAGARSCGGSIVGDRGNDVKSVGGPGEVSAKLCRGARGLECVYC